MKKQRMKKAAFVTFMLLIALVLVFHQPASAQASGITAIYLNGAGGDDANDGQTAGTAVKTFAKAKELATANQAITTIYVTGTVPVDGDVSLAGTNSVLKREATFNGYLLRVASGATATLKNIIVDGNSEQATGAANSLINCSGTLNITDGTVLQNNKIANPADRRTGGAVYSSGGTVNMSGGIIQGNTATWGGGIHLTNYAKLTMTDGIIQNNHVYNGDMTENWNDAAAGGGVCLHEGATFNISGTALINNNTSEEVGGGISVGTIEASIYRRNNLYMAGGTVDGNTARATGGGIFVQAAYIGINKSNESKATITAGSITNNSMLGNGITNYAFGGGGIYVNGLDFDGFSNGQLFLENVVIAENESVLEGGGYAACPVSNTKIYLQDGGAIYRNQAPVAREVFIYSDTRPGWGAHAGNPQYFVSQTMLGGVPYHWKDNNGDEVPLNRLSGKLMGDGISLSLNTDAVGNANTNNLAKVFITGNYSATRGGGIGTNGDVTIGKTPSVIDILVSKTWNDENNKAGKRPARVIVELWRKTAGAADSPIYIGHETITPDNAGNWLLTFTNLPEWDNAGVKYEYSVKERKIPGYTAEISGNAATGFQITNAIAPETVEPKAISILLKANKVLKNGVLKAGEFTFQLRDKQGKVIAETTNAADGTVTFPDRTFSKEVTDWTYTIHEVKGNDPKISYDKTVYTVKISTQMVKGKLEAKVNIEKDGTPYDGSITFTNCYDMPPTGDNAYQALAILLASSLLLGGAYLLCSKRWVHS